MCPPFNKEIVHVTNTKVKCVSNVTSKHVISLFSFKLFLIYLQNFCSFPLRKLVFLIDMYHHAEARTGPRFF